MHKNRQVLIYNTRGVHDILDTGNTATCFEGTMQSLLRRFRACRIDWRAHSGALVARWVCTLWEEHCVLCYCNHLNKGRCQIRWQASQDSISREPGNVGYLQVQKPPQESNPMTSPQWLQLQVNSCFLPFCQVVEFKIALSFPKW